MEYLIVGIGGTLGSITRFALGKLITIRVTGRLPIGTFLINVSGALLLGIVVNIRADKTVYLLLADGFLGAYTTFSAFMYEGFSLFSEKRTLNTLTYVVSSLIMGIIAFWLGARMVEFVR
ncbi:MAG: fluoride efflux transporter CrcB [Clostridia bacterium]|nr:fluoride efflux transporter CrcB [Clostridia bacterium]